MMRAKAIGACRPERPYVSDGLTPEARIRTRTSPAVDSDAQRQQRDALLAQAEVVCITFPFPTRLAARAPRLRFVQQLPAGVSNLVRGDLWHAAIPVASGRGAGNTLPIAEWAIAALLTLSKDFLRAMAQRR